MEIIIKDIVKRRENFRQERLEQLSQAKLNAPSLIINSAKNKELICNKLIYGIQPILNQNGVDLPVDFSVEDTNNDTFTGYKLDLNFNALNIGIGQLFQLLQNSAVKTGIGILEKINIDDWKITTNSYRQYNLAFQLLSGATVTVDMEDLEYDFQNKVNPTLNVDDTGAIPVVNEWAFKRDSILYPHLDRNSLGRGLNRFTFDGKNGVWLWRSVGESRSCSFEIDNLYTPIAGYLPLNGYEFINGEKSLDYPNSNEFGIFADETHTIDMEDTSIAGTSYNEITDEDDGETPIRTISQGQIENITGSFEVLASRSSDKNYQMLKYLKGAFFGGDNIGINENMYWEPYSSSIVQIKNQLIQFDTSRAISSDTQKLVTTGKQTLTRRFGIPMQWKL